MITYTQVKCRTICGPVNVPSEVTRRTTTNTFWPYANCTQCGRSYIWNGTEWFADRTLKDAPAPLVVEPEQFVSNDT